MSGHYYLRPNSLSDNDAVFPYRPSSALHLPSTFPANVNLSPPPTVSPTTAQRNVDLIKGLHNEQKSWEEDGELMRLLRNRTRGWTTSVGRSEGNDEVNESGQTGQKCIELDKLLPRAFQFHKDPDQMRQFWSEGHQRDQSAITRPTPSAMLQTPNRRMGGNEPLKAADVGAGSSLSSSMTASSSSTPASSSKVSPAVPIPDSLSTYLDSHFPPHPPNDPILTISIYSLPLLRSNRLTRRRAAAEKRYDRYKRDRAESLTPTLASHFQQGDNDDVEKEDRTSQQGPTTAESRLFLPRFSLSTAHQPNVTAEDDDGEEDLAPTQRVEMYASQTLQDLRRAMVCRLDDLPHRRGREGSGAEVGLLGVVDRASYTGRKKPPNHDLMIVEGHLAGEDPTDEVYQAIKRRLTTDQQTRAAAGSTPDAENTSEIIECGLQSTRLADLPAVRLHKPYWLLHQGVCEHFWVINRVRLSTAEDPLPPSTRTSTSSSYSHPITTFLARSALLRPIPHFARAKAVEGAYTLGKCSICDRNTAHFAVVGGEGIDQGGSNEEGAEERDRRHRLPALPNQVQTMCQSCLAAFAGQPQPLRIGKDGRFASSSSSSTQAASARKRRRVELRTQGSQSVARDDEGKADSFLRNAAARNADVSDEEVWKLLSERLEREKGWTIVPLLD